MKIVGAGLIVAYFVYLMTVTWGVGKLSQDVEVEVDRLRCRSECKLWKYRRRAPKKECMPYCSPDQ